MEFAYSPALENRRQAIREQIEGHAPVAAVRAMSDSGSIPFHAELWRDVAAQGLCALGAGSAHRESDATEALLLQTIVADELGRAQGAVPLINSWLAHAALADAADPAIASARDRIATGGARVAIHLDPTGITLAQERLSGSAAPISDLPDADWLLTAAASAQGEQVLCLVDLEQPGATIEILQGLDLTHALGRVDLSDAGALVLPADIATVRDRQAILHAFELLGSAEQCLQLATGYAKKRYQFGRPIGSFQALKHKLAALYVEVELARANCYYGAWAHANADEQEGGTLTQAAALAWLSASETALQAGKECIHVHGAVGFTWDIDAHIHLRRAQTLISLLDPADTWRERLLQAELASGGQHAA